MYLFFYIHIYVLFHETKKMTYILSDICYEMDSNIQYTNVIYSNEQLKCCICSISQESNGNILELSNCKHCFHVKCLINYCSKNAMKCPVCNIHIKDNRISFAIAYNYGNTADLINVLTDNKHNIQSMN